MGRRVLRYCWRMVMGSGMLLRRRLVWLCGLPLLLLVILDSSSRSCCCCCCCCCWMGLGRAREREPRYCLGAVAARRGRRRRRAGGSWRGSSSLGGLQRRGRGGADARHLCGVIDAAPHRLTAGGSAPRATGEALTGRLGANPAVDGAGEARGAGRLDAAGGLGGELFPPPPPPLLLLPNPPVKPPLRTPAAADRGRTRETAGKGEPKPSRDEWPKDHRGDLGRVLLRVKSGSYLGPMPPSPPGSGGTGAGPMRSGTHACPS